MLFGGCLLGLWFGVLVVFGQRKRVWFGGARDGVVVAFIGCFQVGFAE